MTVGEMPKSDANREYFNKINEQKVAQGLLPYDTATLDPVIHRMSRNQPYYDRNRAHICSFFVKGTCNRGAACPFRHELPPDDKGDLAHQNIKDRYYGVNDPVAKKLLQRVSNSAVAPPDDVSITTLFVGNVDKRISESDLRDHFYYFGEITSLKLSPTQHCAFVEFTTREAAEAAINKLYSNLIVNGVFLRLSWAKPTQLSQTSQQLASDGGGASDSSRPYYPSMDPERLGTKPEQANTSAASGATVPKPNWTADTTEDEPKKA